MNTTKESPCGTNRKTAIIVGVLYIIGTVAGILSLVSTGPILEGPDYLTQVFTNPNQIVIGALLVLTMGLALAMVPVMMFPVSRKYNETLALGYVLFRGALETVTYIAMVISWLFLIILSQEYVKAGAPDAPYFQSMGTLLMEADNWISQVLTIVFILGALMFYSVLYQSKLIPRWLSGWGLIGAIPYFAAGLLVMFGLIGHMSTIDTVLRLPIALQEMVLAVWLIVKGFDPTAIAARSVKRDLGESYLSASRI
jgi:hypothetical protein